MNRSLIIKFFLVTNVIFSCKALECYLDGKGLPQQEGQVLVTDSFKVFECNLMKQAEEKVKNDKN